MLYDPAWVLGCQWQTLWKLRTNRIWFQSYIVLFEDRLFGWGWAMIGRKAIILKNNNDFGYLDKMSKCGIWITLGQTTFQDVFFCFIYFNSQTLLPLLVMRRPVLPPKKSQIHMIPIISSLLIITDLFLISSCHPLCKLHSSLTRYLAFL